MQKKKQKTNKNKRKNKQTNKQKHASIQALSQQLLMPQLAFAHVSDADSDICTEGEREKTASYYAISLIIITHSTIRVNIADDLNDRVGRAHRIL